MIASTRRAVRRIAMLSVHTCPLATLGGKKTGGMNVYVRDLSRAFSQRGIKVDVFTRSQDPCAPHVNLTLAEHARVIHSPTGPESPLETNAVYPYLPQFVDNVLAFSERENLSYDVVYSHYWLSGWAAHELRASWQSPVVQMFHTLGHMKNRIAGQPDDPSKDIRVFTETDIMSWAEALIAATPAERAQMLWLYQADRRKIHIVPPGVDLEHFHPLDREQAKTAIGVPPTNRMLLFVGRIERLKGIDTLLHAIAIMRREQPETCQALCMSIIGGDPDDPTHEEMARLKATSESLNLHDLVAFVGKKDQDSLRYYYNAAEALVMPSDYESFGMVALEAMACGTPVIASEVGGLAYLVRDGENGFHVPVREPEALAARITCMLEDPARRARMSQVALETAQHYAWPDIADRLLEIFATLPGVPGVPGSATPQPPALPAV
ncbi:MAG: glycosyltransferase [Anaerolineae bacterium]|nr:glycosyltransferase [Anaerolineae bacterium]